MLVRFIGDVHGKFKQYKRLIADVLVSIQVGDMGVGFRHTQGYRAGEEYGNPPFDAMMKGNHRFIRGNHDNPASCARHARWIPDGTVENGAMFIGGADSIDRHLRIKDYTWWEDEELSIAELDRLVGVYQDVKPRVMVTHDCPAELATVIPWSNNSSQKLMQHSRTRQAFQAMWCSHSPELWIFGHWHVHFEAKANGTEFMCLPELQHVDLEI